MRASVSNMLVNKAVGVSVKNVINNQSLGGASSFITCPCLVYATTEGTMRDPLIGISIGLPPSIHDTAENVVPKSIPTDL